jgi:hypothetical protein
MIVEEGGNVFEIPWRVAWSSTVYRKKFLAAAIPFTIVLLFFPYFFNTIQQRQGVVLNDWVLNVLPSVNVSIYIFSIIYLVIGFGIFRAVQSPVLFLLFLWCSLFLSLSRMLTISLVPLEPPVGLVELVDPVLLPFYGHSSITKDLFYSGHTSSVFLIYLILRNKREKLFALVATVIVGVLLLIQHIHYTIDVLFAPVFVYLVFILAKKVTNISTVD